MTSNGNTAQKHLIKILGDNMKIFTIIKNPKTKKEKIQIFKTQQDADKMAEQLKKQNTQFLYYITKYMEI